MRKYFLAAACVAFIHISSPAQISPIDTSEISFENKLRPCLHTFYDAGAREVKAAWSDYLKRNHHIKIKGSGPFSGKEMLSARDVIIPSISDKRMNLFLRSSDVAGGSEVKYFMSFGYDFFIGPENFPHEFAGMKKMLKDFSKEFLIKYYADFSTNSLKKIKGYQREIKSRNNNISKNNKKMEKASSAEISGLEARNNALQMDIDMLNGKIESIRKELEGIKIKQGAIAAIQ